jgi:hypothetical protein
VPSGLLFLQIVAYSLALWLGLYLIGRNPAKPPLRYAGLGLVFYALSLATDLLAMQAPTAVSAELLTRLHWPLLFLPAAFWFGATVHLLPEDTPWQGLLSRSWGYGLLPLAIPFYLFSAGTDLIFDFSTDPPQPGPAYLLFAGLVMLPMLVALLLAIWAFLSAQPRKPLGLLLAATLFFTLGAALLLLPYDWPSRTWLLLGISLDFIMLGLAIALLDALDEGEALLPDIFLSFDFSSFFVLLFGGLIGLTIALGTGLTFPMLALLLATIAAAIITQAFADPLQAAVDKFAFAAFPRLWQARADLRFAASTLPRVKASFEPDQVGEAEFARLTRRALSHLGDLPRLATSPLTRLALVDERLVRRQARDDTLERATELKTLLTESILRLKPQGKGEFGTSEEWRYYNALYFPYVVGLRPYSRRAEHAGLEPTEREALNWFRTYVPERTLYNWQNAAARLVAQDLCERQQETIN